MDPRERGQNLGPQPKDNIVGTEFDFGGIRERIVTRDDFPLERARQVLKGETIAVAGYGVQGPAQALNLRGNGFNVIVGQRAGSTFEKAVQDGWVPGRNLFSITEAVQRGTQAQYLLSDTAQGEVWSAVLPLLRPGDTLCFSHGFAIAYRDQTGVVPPPDVDVILVAPKGAGRSVREHFLQGRGINASFAVFQDATGRARERALATGMAIGSGFLFPTTFEKEVFSDLVGERGVLMGAFYGLAQAGYNSLRSCGYSPEQAVSHTVEISTQTISKIIGEKGADGLIQDLPADLLGQFSNGFIAAYGASSPVFDDLYQRVATGVEAKRVLEANSRPDYRDTLNDELRQIEQSELGAAGSAVRAKRVAGPVVPSHIQNREDAIMAGALVGLFHAQYELFRSKGHLPSEAFNETGEEATQSLWPLIDQRGIPWMYANCSTTAQRGALDWNGVFRNAIFPQLDRLYKGESVVPSDGVRAHILNSEMWRAGKTVRALRPEAEAQKIA